MSFLRVNEIVIDLIDILNLILGRGQQLLSRLPGNQDPEEDLRQVRLHKFADSLMKQKELQQKANQQMMKKAENMVKKSKSDTSQEGSPVRRKLRKKMSSPRNQAKSGKSTSLTDLTQMNRSDLISGTHSFSDISPRSFVTSCQNEASSSSSTANTIVPSMFQGNTKL